MSYGQPAILKVMLEIGKISVGDSPFRHAPALPRASANPISQAASAATSQKYIQSRNPFVMNEYLYIQNRNPFAINKSVVMGIPPSNTLISNTQPQNLEKYIQSRNPFVMNEYLYIQNRNPFVINKSAVCGVPPLKPRTSEPRRPKPRKVYTEPQLLCHERIFVYTEPQPFCHQQISGIQDTHLELQLESLRVGAWARSERWNRNRVSVRSD